MYICCGVSYSIQILRLLKQCLHLEGKLQKIAFQAAGFMRINSWLDMFRVHTRTSGALNFDLQHVVFCTEFLNGWFVLRAAA